MRREKRGLGEPSDCNTSLTPSEREREGRLGGSIID